MGQWAAQQAQLPADLGILSQQVIGKDGQRLTDQQVI
jgi:hypothetical protein